MAQRRTIEDFGLARIEGQPEDRNSYNFLVPFAGPMSGSEWIWRQINNPSDQDPYGLLQYAINSPKKAFIVHAAFLTTASALTGRKTDMRLWQMIADSWVAAGNRSDSLRYLAVSLIVNADIRTNIDSEWKHQEDQGQQMPFGTDYEILTITRRNTSVTFDQNHFVRSAVRVAEALSTVEKIVTVEKVHLVRAQHHGRYMVIEFRNGDAGQETYREKLIRKFVPMVTYQLEQKIAERQAGREWENIVFLPPNLYPGRR